MHIFPFINTSCVFRDFPAIFVGDSLSVLVKNYFSPSCAHIPLHKHKLSFKGSWYLKQQSCNAKSLQAQQPDYNHHHHHNNININNNNNNMRCMPIFKFFREHLSILEAFWGLIATTKWVLPKWERLWYWKLPLQKVFGNTRQKTP